MSQARLARNAAVQKMVIAELARKMSDNSLYSYLKVAWPLIEPKLPFIDGWHIGCICEHLEAVFSGEIRNLLINIPPRHAKSTIVSVGFPSWVWTKKAHHKFLYASHSYALSKRDSVKTRNIIESQWYRETFNVQWKLAEDQNEKTNFLNSEGGFRRATSVMGAIIGEGGDTLVLDDPHSPRSVRSEVKRQDALDWIDEEFFTRKNDPKTVSKIIIMQRLDERDASAHVLEKGDWDHLCLPAGFESQHPFPTRTSIHFTDPRKKEGEALWPERFDEAENEKSKKDMGSKAWAGQGQQRPAPADGIIFKREWFKFFQLDPMEMAQKMNFLALSIDLPFDEAGTYAVFQIWGRLGADKYLLDQTRGQVGFKEQKSMAKAMIAKWAMLSAKWIEKKANGAALIADLRADVPGLVPITPHGSKEMRAELVAPQFEAGNVFIPDPSIAPWVGDYIEEMVVFNNGKFNDQVDATTQALAQFMSRPQVTFQGASITKESTWRY